MADLKSKFRTAGKGKSAKDFSVLKGAGDLKPKTPMFVLLKLWFVMLKNYKLMVRSKTSVLIFFFGPLLLMFLVGVGFNTSSLVGLTIATYSESYSPLSESLLANLSDSQFTVAKVTSQDECIESVKFESFQMCIIFPKDMAVDNSIEDNNIVLYVDNSRLNIANEITRLLSSKVELQAEEVSSGLVSDMLAAMGDVNAKALAGRSTVNALDSSQDNIQSRIGILVGNFDAVDFSYSGLDTSGALSEITDIEEDYNISSSAFDELKVAIGNLGTQYSALGKKLDDAKEKSKALQDDASAISGLVGSTKTSIVTTGSTFDEITAEVSRIKVTNVASIVSPITTTIKPLSLKRSYLIFTFPILLIILVMFVTLLMSSTGIMREKSSKAYFRNFITPTYDGLFMVGQYLTDLSIILLQLAIVLGLASVFIHEISWQVYIIVGSILLILATLFIFLGMAIGYLFNTQESVSVAAVSVSLIFLVFSNAILPIEALSGVLRKVVEYNPVVIAESILKRLLIFDTNVAAINKLAYLLLIYIGVAFVLAIIIRELKKRFARSASE
ncbi:ABC transporter permease [Candidatus Woesearchaeota archaeon]|nr:ABC transporter permease [Candidatus Woesearchaeota archaeon]